MRDFAVFQVATCFGDFEPIQIMESRRSLGDRRLDGILDRNFRGTGQFDFFVNVIGHRDLLKREGKLGQDERRQRLSLRGASIRLALILTRCADRRMGQRGAVTTVL